MPITRLHLPPGRLKKRLPEDGSAGATEYGGPGAPLDLSGVAGIEERDRAQLEEAATASETGFVAVRTGAAITLILPAFETGVETRYDEVYLRPLVESLERPRSYAVLLLRLGGFSLGFFRHHTLVDSKTDQRFVKGRHRKGGQSSNRFARIREKQIHELYGKTCEAAQEKLAPYEGEIEQLFFGGDRRTVLAFRKECAYIERFGGRIRDRHLRTPGDPRLDMLRSMPDEVRSSEVLEVEIPGAGVAPGAGS